MVIVLILLLIASIVYPLISNRKRNTEAAMAEA
jgi:hypothetical protein